MPFVYFDSLSARAVTTPSPNMRVMGCELNATARALDPAISRDGVDGGWWISVREVWPQLAVCAQALASWAWKLGRLGLSSGRAWASDKTCAVAERALIKHSWIVIVIIVKLRVHGERKLAIECPEATTIQPRCDPVFLIHFVWHNVNLTFR